MHILLLATLILIIYWIIEYARHRSNVSKIPHRIHINGTRGKSSVTRLIAAGLRAGGKRTVAKTTGTLPRMILEDGSEGAIIRLSGANIIEQKYIFRHSLPHNPEILVIECMAVNPIYQWISEYTLVKSTLSVITNSRLDHTDQMGETLESITNSLCNTIPQDGICLTSEVDQLATMKKVAAKRNTAITCVPTGEFSAAELKAFQYIEHPENIALSLAVCKHYGVARDVALKGMQEMMPDPGALKKYQVIENKKEINFYNVFAANDPSSSEFIFHMITKPLDKEQVFIVLNSRADRYYRSIQLLEVCAKLKFDYLLLTGERTVQLQQTAKEMNVSAKVIHVGEPDVAQVYQKILELTDKESHVLGIGNIAGEKKYGGQIVNYFYYKSKGGGK